MPLLIGWGEVMTESNILPYDGQAVLIDDNGAEFDWPAITRTLVDTLPWQVETAQILGREMPIPRMTVWFGDRAYSYSGILHLPAPFPAIVERLRARAEALSGATFMPLWPTSIGTVVTTSGGTVITRPGLGTVQP
jgi:hypothetical protein